jgi:predicted transcriptional regulator
MDKKDRPMISFRIPLGTKRRMERMASVCGTTQTSIIIEALRKELGRWEAELKRKKKVWQEIEEGR